MIFIEPLGKWLQISRDNPDQQVVIIPDGAPVGCVARVEAVGAQCGVLHVQDRILIEEDSVKTFAVAGEALYVIHEDHVIGILR